MGEVGREDRLARGAAGRCAGAGEPDAAGRIDHSDFPGSEFRPGRSSEFRARGGLASGAPALELPPAGTVRARTGEQLAPAAPAASIWPPASVRSAGRRCWERLLRADCGMDRAKRFTPSSSGPIRSGRQRLTHRPLPPAEPRRRPRRCGRAPPCRGTAAPRPMRRRAPRGQWPALDRPDQDGAAPAPRVRTALARPTRTRRLEARGSRGAAVGRRRLCGSGHLAA